MEWFPNFSLSILGIFFCLKGVVQVISQKSKSVHREDRYQYIEKYTSGHHTHKSGFVKYIFISVFIVFCSFLQNETKKKKNLKADKPPTIPFFFPSKT